MIRIRFFGPGESVQRYFSDEQYSRAGGPTEAGSAAFLGRVRYKFVTGVWEAGLLLAGVLVGYIGLVKGMMVDVHCAQYFVNSSLAPVVLFRRRLKDRCGCSQRY